jgi:CRP/FNR family transcriptional regulator, cyclic AMP receptor protein
MNVTPQLVGAERRRERLLLRRKPMKRDLTRIALWSHGLTDAELRRALEGVTERAISKGTYICHRGDYFDFWTGVSSGLLKASTLSKTGKPVTLLGVRDGGWFGEGTILKQEPRQYDIVALRDTQLALMDRKTFFWLYETSVGFNRFLVTQFNERLSQFIGFVENERMLDAPARLARNIASLFNPVLYPEAGPHIELSQEEIGLLSGISRQSANKGLKILEQAKLLRVEYGGITVLDLKKLSKYE